MNTSQTTEDEKSWFAMRAIFHREMAAMRLLEAEGVEHFIPMRRQTQTIRGRQVSCLVPAIRNLIFVHARPETVRRIKARAAYLQYIPDAATGRMIVVPDDQMRRFIAVAGSCDDRLLWLRPEEVNWSRGMRVRVTGGPFCGQEGVLVKVKGARDRRVVVAVEGVVAIAMATIRPDLIEPIEGSAGHPARRPGSK
ncbi:UpxY family transcription antiterminator [uncultured Alistipes sp.]|uniref:UpxY family transcription antiterminator n=1 Tax=uncultured Alistipes sp. TaxID=538949 RepID=UPI0025E91FEB|nr:UpxY family transcription antiterminator [uncultured Alistipes sp.]